MICKIKECNKKALALGFCSMHYSRYKGYNKVPLNAPHKHPNYGTGRIIDKDGYYQIKINGKYRREHRVIMEKKLQRDLKREELVHHINGNKLDNRIENLQLMSFRQHALKHLTLIKGDIEKRIIGLYKLGVPATDINRYVPYSISAILKCLKRNKIQIRGIHNRNLH